VLIFVLKNYGFLIYSYGIIILPVVVPKSLPDMITTYIPLPVFAAPVETRTAWPAVILPAFCLAMMLPLKPVMVITALRILLPAVTKKELPVTIVG
jgi:hypothetical protein